MKMLKLMALVTVVAAMFTASGCTNIEPGHVGIKIDRAGSTKGVTNENICSGFVGYIPFLTKIVEYPIYNQRVVWTEVATEGAAANEELSFTTKDSIKVNMDVAVNYKLIDGKVPFFYTYFRADDIRTFSNGFLRDQARNVSSRIGSEYTFDEINGTKKEEFMTKLSAALSVAVATVGVEVNPTNGLSLLGSPRPPKELTTAVNAKVQAIQDSMRVENELRSVTAEAKKVVAKAQGEADAYKAKALVTTPAVLELKRLDIQAAIAAKWDGKLSTTTLGGATPIIQLGSK